MAAIHVYNSVAATETVYTNIASVEQYLQSSLDSPILAHNRCELIALDTCAYLLPNQVILLNEKHCDCPVRHDLYFSGCLIYLEYEANADNLLQVLSDPTVAGLYNMPESCVLPSVPAPTQQTDISGGMCHINVSKLCVNDCSTLGTTVQCCINKLKSVVRRFRVYRCHTLPPAVLEDNSSIIAFYKSISGLFGDVVSCAPVNTGVAATASRDIRFTNGSHYYSSNQRQPLHNDYAYYPADCRPDWLALFCLQPSQYGGITSVVFNDVIMETLAAYNPDLHSAVEAQHITYEWHSEGNSLKHVTPLFTQNVASNWNYYQFRPELNDSESHRLRDEFFDFLENYITGGNIVSCAVQWKRGDGLFMNDNLVMHQRSSFIGSRWLKDFAIKDTSMPLVSSISAD